MNFIILLVSTLVTINGINGLPINLNHRSGGPDADSLDPIGSNLLRPVFLGKSTGIRRSSHGLTSRSSQDRQPELEQELEPELEPQFQSEPLFSVGPDGPEVMEDTQHFGLPLSGRRQKIRNERIFHPDSDGMRGRFGQIVVDDPLPEMMAGGDIAANPFAETPSLSSIFGQLLMTSIGL